MHTQAGRRLHLSSLQAIDHSVVFHYSGQRHMACFGRIEPEPVRPERDAQPVQPMTLGQELVNLLFSETGSAPTNGEDLWTAADTGNDYWLSKRPASELIARNAHGDTILHVVQADIFALSLTRLQAAAKGHIDIIDLLASRNVLSSLINIPNNYNEQPIHRACVAGQRNFVAMLVQKGADFNALNGHSETPFYMACYNGHLEVVEYLLKVKGCRYRECGPESQKPVDVARIRGHATIRNLIRRQERWYYQRVIWIGHVKDKDSQFSRLPTSVVKIIVVLFITMDGRLKS